MTEVTIKHIGDTTLGWLNYDAEAETDQVVDLHQAAGQSLGVGTTYEIRLMQGRIAFYASPELEGLPTDVEAYDSEAHGVRILSRRVSHGAVLICRR